jgi:AcrR family transcriptional regulator
MARKVTSTPRKRRTQAERRAATRAALLDAALACLVEEGYANLTTRRVAERAGVSQGTQMHYFPTRAQFVVEAVRHVAGELAEGAGTRSPPRAHGDRARLEWALDELWEVHGGPVFAAAMELWVAARTDAEVRAALQEASRDITRMIVKGAVELFPDLMAKPGAGELLDTTLAAIRGLAILRFHGDPNVDRRWAATRRQLLEYYDGMAP